MKRACNKSPDLFCYICGLFTPKSSSRGISKTLKTAYLNRFNVPIQDQEKCWAPHISCNRCYQALIKNKRLPFSFPMVWFEPVGHHDCYFCVTNITGHTIKTRLSINYADVTSAKKPIPGVNDALVPASCDTPQEIPSSSPSTSVNETDSDECFPASANPNSKISQSQLDNLVKEFGFSKSDSQKMGRMLRSFNVLDDSVSYSHYRKRDLKYSPFFRVEDSIVFCCDIDGLLKELLFDRDINNWWLFIDSSCSSYKMVMLHKLSQCPPFPVVYSREQKETYDTVKKSLDLIKYSELQLPICGDLKIVGFLMGLQKGYVKHMCFLCLWNTREKSNQYTHGEWPLRKHRVIGQHNVTHPPLIPPRKILLPPLHIKLGLFKQFIKSLESENAKEFLAELFPKMTDAKLKEGVFVGPQLRRIMENYEEFSALLNTNERRAWETLVSVTKGFLGKHRDSNYKDLVSDMLKAFEIQKVRMSLKVHFLNSHLDFFHDDFGNVTDEHGERFHQTILTIEKRYSGRADERMMGDFCWLLKA
jgi:hypothetical protein